MTRETHIEIVVPERVLRKVLALIERHNPGAYAAMHGMSEQLHRGMQSGDAIVEKL